MPGKPLRNAHPIRGTQLRMLLAGLLCLLLAACATLSAPSPEARAAAVQADQLYRQGEFERAAAAFLALAEANRGNLAAGYQLRAAEAWRQAGNLPAAERVLEDIRRRRLRGDEVVRYDLLGAEVALHEGDPERARAYLHDLPPDLPTDLQVRALELAARADLASGDAVASARQRALLDAYLHDPDRSYNRRELITTLEGVDSATLTARAQALPDTDPLLPWIEQVLRLRGQPLARSLARPERPVGTLEPDARGDLHAESYRPVHHVALLLPLDTSLAAVAQSIRDGFLTLYFNTPPEQRPELRIHAVGSTPASALEGYQRAVAAGADHVVGPLQRESVGALFHQPLSVPVLALNHPETGEAPPPGSLEFGLLPEAEGAQAAGHMLERGIRQAAVIIAEADWAQRAAGAFRTQFEAGGGRIAGEARLPADEVNFSTAINVATAGLGSGADAGIFISMRPQQGRLLLPQLRIAGLRVPVLSTSHIYSGESNATLDRDLDGVEFCDAPWLFGPLPGRPDRLRVSSQLTSANGVGARLYAFGMDAWALLPYMDWLLIHPDAYLEGATGDLSADAFGRIHRTLAWARFENGIARPIEGALHMQPVGP